jgi:DNA-binding response OmpR family regulator
MTTPAIGVVLVVAMRDASDDAAVHTCLAAAGLAVRVASDVESVVKTGGRTPTEVILLAVTDDKAGAKAVAQLTDAGFAGSILAASRDPDPAHVATVLDRGADDYVRLPCNPRELAARVRAVSRRGSIPPVLEREIGGLVLDLRRGVVRSDEGEVALTRREADLLEYLARHAGHPVSRAELAMQIWHTATPNDASTNIVDVYISYLRRKLATLGKQSIIRSVRGVGYELMTGDYGMRADK